MKTLNIHDRLIHVVDSAIPDDIMMQWRHHVLNYNHGDENIYQDIGHDFMSDKTIVENNIIKHDSRSSLQIIQHVKSHILGIVKNIIPHADYRINSWYTNLIDNKSQAWVHRDSRAPGNQSFTVLWFPHEHWHVNWGGETLFYHVDTSDIEFFNKALRFNPQIKHKHEELNNMLQQADITAVIPKPNRMIIFDSSLLHAARPPQHNSLRLSTAFKLCKKG